MNSHAENSVPVGASAHENSQVVSSPSSATLTKVFHPMRVFKMMETYGDDWDEKV